MEVKDIIESGSLELYVIGALPADEMRQIDELRLHHPELNEEIARIEQTLEEFASAQAVMPQPELKEQIAKKLKFGVELDLEDEKISSVIVELTPVFKLAAAAAVLIIVGLTASTMYFSSKYSEANRRLAALSADKDVLAHHIELLDRDQKALEERLVVMAYPKNNRVVLNGQPAAPQAQAVVYWNAQKGEVHLDVAQLPVADNGKQFQLWAIVAGKPVDLGVVNKTGSFFKMKDIKDAQAFAITLEPMGGSAAPTLNQLYVLGNV